jgi:hypothetical protein
VNNKKESLQEFSTVSHIKNTMDVERFLLAHSLIQDFPGFIFIFFIQQFSSEIKFFCSADGIKVRLLVIFVFSTVALILVTFIHPTCFNSSENFQ